MPRKGGRRSSVKRIRGGRPISRPKGVVSRKTPRNVSRRGTSPKVIVNRNLRRQNTLRQANKIAPRSRPTVRPSRTPSRMMPKASSKGKPIRRKIVRPSRRPMASAKAIKRSANRNTGLASAAAVVGAAGAVFALSRLNLGKAHPEIAMEANSLQTSLNELQDLSSFEDVRDDITNLESNLTHALTLLESARDKGYKFQKDLEEIAYDAMSRWQGMHADLDKGIQDQISQAGVVLNPLNQELQRLNMNLSNASTGGRMMGAVQSSVNQAERELQQAANKIEGSYSDIETQVSQITSRLTRIHWALTQQEEATFPMEDEDLVMAVKARWDQEGKEDPEGILFLTDKRLAFERKEKVATKKVLFVTTSSELVQELIIEKPAKELKKVKAQNKGLFGNHDFLEVDFGDQVVPFHLQGQSSEKWVHLIQDVQTGKIEEDRATGAGLSFTDLIGDITQADIIEVQNEVNELQDEMMLKSVQDEVTELENAVGELTRDLSDLRARGYLIEKSLEIDIEVLMVQWERIKTNTKTTIEFQTKFLAEQMNGIQEKMAKVAGMSGNLTAARPMYIQLKSAIASAEAQAEAAEETVLDQYDAYADEIESLDSHFEWIDWMLDAISTASFQLLATESGVSAIEAVWERPGLDPENGILFLTDQRLLWEDREGDYELKLDIPVSEVEKVIEEEDEDSGEEKLYFTLGSSAPYPKARFALATAVGTNWIQMIGRAKSDDYSTDRAVEIDEAELDRIRNAPQQCGQCGGALTAPILRGQTEITCEFCGSVTRI